MFNKKLKEAMQTMKENYERRIIDINERHAKELVKESCIRDSLNQRIAELEAELKFQRDLNDKLFSKLVKLEGDRQSAMKKGQGEENENSRKN